MGLMNVYNFANITNWHLPFRFKATFQPTPTFAVGDDIQSFSVKSISKPHYSLGTDAINQYYGTTRFVMPTIEFDKATMDITYVEEENGDMQYSLLNTLGNALNNNSGITNIRIDEYDIGMTKILSSRVYTCQLKSIDMPEYTRSGKASIMTVTAHYVVHAIYNTSLSIEDIQNPISQNTINDLNDSINQNHTEVNTESPIQEINPPAIPKKPNIVLKYIKDDPLVQQAAKERDEADEHFKAGQLIYVQNLIQAGVLTEEKMDAAISAYLADSSKREQEKVEAAGNFSQAKYSTTDYDKMTVSGQINAFKTNNSAEDIANAVMLGLGVNGSNGIDSNEEKILNQLTNMAVTNIQASISASTLTKEDGINLASDLAAAKNEMVASSLNLVANQESYDDTYNDARIRINAENTKNTAIMEEYNDSLIMYGLKTTDQLNAESKKNEAAVVATVAEYNRMLDEAESGPAAYTKSILGKESEPESNNKMTKTDGISSENNKNFAADNFTKFVFTDQMDSTGRVMAVREQAGTGISICGASSLTFASAWIGTDERLNSSNGSNAGKDIAAGIIASVNKTGKATAVALDVSNIKTVSDINKLSNLVSGKNDESLVVSIDFTDKEAAYDALVKAKTKKLAKQGKTMTDADYDAIKTAVTYGHAMFIDKNGTHSSGEQKTVSTYDPDAMQELLDANAVNVIATKIKLNN